MRKALGLANVHILIIDGAGFYAAQRSCHNYLFPIELFILASPARAEHIALQHIQIRPLFPTPQALSCSD
jgi:hypothetical protein